MGALQGFRKNPQSEKRRIRGPYWPVQGRRIASRSGEGSEPLEQYRLGAQPEVAGTAPTWPKAVSAPANMTAALAIMRKRGIRCPFGIDNRENRRNRPHK